VGLAGEQFSQSRGNPADGIATAFVHRIESLQSPPAAEWMGAAALVKL
jgi:hypothetical protein